VIVGDGLPDALLPSLRDTDLAQLSALALHQVQNGQVSGHAAMSGIFRDMAYGFIEHSGEHYGQLVVYYRLSGLVPPESRPKKVTI
jgi:hypothetical protein